MSAIDALPGAARFAGDGVKKNPANPSNPDKPWWEELFKTSKVTP